jgi:hypothetical protein
MPSGWRRLATEASQSSSPSATRRRTCGLSRASSGSCARGKAWRAAACRCYISSGCRSASRDISTASSSLSSQPDRLHIGHPHCSQVAATPGCLVVAEPAARWASVDGASRGMRCGTRDRVGPCRYCRQICYATTEQRSSGLIKNYLFEYTRAGPSTVRSPVRSERGPSSLLSHGSSLLGSESRRGRDGRCRAGRVVPSRIPICSDP